MNVLFVLPYCYVPEINKSPSTGFGIYTVQLAEEITKKQNINVFVLCMKQHITHDINVNGVIYIGFPNKEIIVNCLHKRVIQYAFNIYKYNYEKYNFIKDVIKAVYTASKGSMLEKVIEKYSIDFIHIHSLEKELYGIFQSPYINNSNTLVTIHSDFVYKKEFGAYNDFFRRTAERLFKNNIPVSFVSTGVKDHFVDEINDINSNLHVIVNGTVMDPVEYKKDTSNAIFTFVCIGTVGNRKNQMFILDALNYLSKSALKNIRFEFLGIDRTEGEFDKRIMKYDLADICENCGFVNPEDVEKHLMNADGTIMVSVQEAFGLSVIEGFQYGLPALTYSDLAASSDFYSEDAVMFIKDRTVNALADAIIGFASRKWDRKKIKAWGQRFKLNNIADEYVDLYETILGME